MKLGKKKRLKCNIDGSSRLSESDSETEFIFSVKTKPEPAKSWPTLHVILITLAFIAICTVTTVALWLSGLFSTFSHLNTLGKSPTTTVSNFCSERSTAYWGDGSRNRNRAKRCLYSNSQRVQGVPAIPDYLSVLAPCPWFECDPKCNLRWS